MKKNTYQPIPCADYDIYEISIMQNKLLQLTWESANGALHNEKLKPEKLHIKNKAEYLILEKDTEIRLDKIIQAEIINK